MNRADKVCQAAAGDEEGGAEMKRYGITRVQVDYFHLAGFRYTSLRDAIAQARRTPPAAGERL